MDFHLTHFFRTVCEDALLIIDVIRINPSFKPLKESWLNCFTEGMPTAVPLCTSQSVCLDGFADSEKSVLTANPAWVISIVC